MNKEEAIKRIRQNISAAEFHMGLTQLRSTIENELLDIEAFKMAIKALEVDLVLCKECKYAHMTYGGECKYCDNWSLEDPLYLDGDFFCSYGERSRR